MLKFAIFFVESCVGLNICNREHVSKLNGILSVSLWFPMIPFTVWCDTWFPDPYRSIQTEIVEGQCNYSLQLHVKNLICSGTLGHLGISSMFIIALFAFMSKTQVSNLFKIFWILSRNLKFWILFVTHLCTLSFLMHKSLKSGNIMCHFNAFYFSLHIRLYWTIFRQKANIPSFRTHYVSSWHLWQSQSMVDCKQRNLFRANGIITTIYQMDQLSWNCYFKLLSWSIGQKKCVSANAGFFL